MSPINKEHRCFALFYIYLYVCLYIYTFIARAIIIYVKYIESIEINNWLYKLFIPKILGRFLCLLQMWIDLEESFFEEPL
jgi:hypothetical protein